MLQLCATMLNVTQIARFKSTYLLKEDLTARFLLQKPCQPLKAFQITITNAVYGATKSLSGRNLCDKKPESQVKPK